MRLKCLIPGLCRGPALDVRDWHQTHPARIASTGPRVSVWPIYSGSVRTHPEGDGWTGSPKVARSASVQKCTFGIGHIECGVAAEAFSWWMWPDLTPMCSTTVVHIGAESAQRGPKACAWRPTLDVFEHISPEHFRRMGTWLRAGGLLLRGCGRSARLGLDVRGRGHTFDPHRACGSRHLRARWQMAAMGVLPSGGGG